MITSPAIWRTSEKKRIVIDKSNNFSIRFDVTYSFDHNELFDNEYDLWVRFQTKPLITQFKVYTGFDEDVYDFLENMLTGSNSFTIFEELKQKGMI